MKLRISMVILMIISLQTSSIIKGDNQDFIYKVNKEDTRKYRFVQKINETSRYDIIEIIIEAASENSITLNYTGYPPNPILEKSCFDSYNSTQLDYAICHFGWFDFYIGNDTYTSIPIVGIFIAKTTDVNGWEKFIENDTDYKVENPHIIEERSYAEENNNYNYTRKFSIENGWLVFQKHEEYFDSVNTTIFYSFEDITENLETTSITNLSTVATSNGFGIIEFTIVIGSVLLMMLKKRRIKIYRKINI